MRCTGLRFLRVTLTLALSGILAGCAYYNTFYFAKKHFNQGERSRSESESEVVPGNAVRSYDKAILQCKKVLNFHTDSRWVDDAVFLMGASYYGKAAYDSALTTFGDYIRGFPESEHLAEAEYYRGLCHYESNDFEEMDQAFARTLEIDPEFEHIDDILYTRAQTSERQLNYTKAIRSYRQLVDAYPGTDRGEDGLLEIGRLYFESEQYDSALVAYRELVDATKDEERYQQGQLQMGRSLIRLGGAEEALARLRRQLPAEEGVQRTARSDYSPQVRLIMAQALNRLERYEDAVEALAVVPEKYKSSIYAAEAQYQIGFTYESYMDSLSLAEDAYEIAAKMPTKSAFRDLARERLIELKKLISLANQTTAQSEGDAALEKQAEAALKIAELYYFSRRELDLAKGQYRTVIDEYPETSIAPRAAYGLAWLALREEPSDTLQAYESFRDLVRDFPASTQARSAIDLLAAADVDTLGLAEILVEPEPVPIPEVVEEPEVPENLRIPHTSSLAGSLLVVGADGDSLARSALPAARDSLRDGLLSTEENAEGDDAGTVSPDSLTVISESDSLTGVPSAEPASPAEVPAEVPAEAIRKRLDP